MLHLFGDISEKIYFLFLKRVLITVLMFQQHAISLGTVYQEEKDIVLRRTIKTI